MRKNSHPSSTIFSAGFLVEENGSELPVKQNHYTVNFQSIFIRLRRKKPYWPRRRATRGAAEAGTNNHPKPPTDEFPHRKKPSTLVFLRGSAAMRGDSWPIVIYVAEGSAVRDVCRPGGWGWGWG